jgi:NAD+ kinase
LTLVGFVVHGGRDSAIRVAADLAAWLSTEHVRSRSLEDVDIGATERASEQDFAAGLDLVVSVGGDGTFLRAAHKAFLADCPVVGVKVGRVGFLTAVEPEGAQALTASVLTGTASVDERLAVVAEPAGTAWTEPQWALNELMVEKRARHRVIRLAVLFDDEYVTTFSADGVIVATPTGSTAYSFSARGPIVSPRVRGLVVTPVAAHMVFDRSFVLSAAERVTIEVRGEEPGLLSGDGRAGLELPVGSRVTVRVADRPARLVRPQGVETFYSRVRDRFHLPDGDAT